LPRKRKNEEGLQNPTADKLDGLPFSTIKELREAEREAKELVFKRLSQADLTRKLLWKKYRGLLNPLLQGINAKYVGKDGEGLGRGYLNEDESITVEIDKSLISNDKNDLMESVVRILSQSVLKGYFEVVGLHQDTANFENLDKSKPPTP